MSIEFEIHPRKQGSFVHPRAMERVVEPFDELLENRRAGALSETAYVRELKALLEMEPDFIDGYAHLANTLFEKGKTKTALEVYRQGIAVGERVIPPVFKGTIEWADLDNRPFLRAMPGAALAYLRLHRYKDAVAVMEQILAYNPNDNQGVRYLIGSAYFRAGDKLRAESALEKEALAYPPCAYELALLHAKSRDWVQAATALRVGFCTNPYVAEMLCGVRNPQPLAMWHASNFHMPETAYDYVKDAEETWARVPDALRFLRWLFRHSRVLEERAQYQGPLEALLWEESGEKRVALGRLSDAVLSKIDDTHSREIIAKRRGRDGRENFPWQYKLPFYG